MPHFTGVPSPDDRRDDSDAFAFYDPSLAAFVAIAPSQTEVLIDAHQHWAQMRPVCRYTTPGCEAKRMDEMESTFRQFASRQTFLFENALDYKPAPTFIHSRLIVGSTADPICTFLAEVRNHDGHSVILGSDRAFIFKYGAVFTRVFEKDASDARFSCEALFSPAAFLAEWQLASGLIFNDVPYTQLLQESLFMRLMMRGFLESLPGEKARHSDVSDIVLSSSNAPLALTVRTNRGEFFLGPSYDISSCRVAVHVLSAD